MMGDTNNTVRVSELAEELGMRTSTIYRAVETGRLHSFLDEDLEIMIIVSDELLDKFRRRSAKRKKVYGVKHAQ